MAKMTLRHHDVDRYLKQRFGPEVRLVQAELVGKESKGRAVKQYGYGRPVRLVLEDQGRIRQVVIETMCPGPFGHEHRADRAQALLWDYDSYCRLPRHVPALDVGAFDARGRMFSIAQATEFFLLTEWADGEGYQLDLYRLLEGGRLRPLDRRRAEALATYLAEIHRRKRRDPALYRRRLRELIGHGECIMGLTDSYPDRFGFITSELLESIETACNRWRWRLRRCTGRLSQVHGDFHPWNVLFRQGQDFRVLDRSRGEWGEPADDVTAMTVNYLFFSLQRHGKLAGAFEVLFRRFWERYQQASGDRRVTETAAPFFAFRGLVLASPLWYPKLTEAVRRSIFRFVQNVLAAERFDPGDANRYLR